MKCGFLCLLISESRCGGRRRGAVFAQDFKPAKTLARRLARPEKNLCTGCVSWRVDRSRETKNARIGANSIRRFGRQRPSTARRWRHGASRTCPILIARETSAGIARCARERRSDPDLLLQEIVDGLRVGLAARCLHDLADEPTERFWVRLSIGDLLRMPSKNAVN